MLRRPALRAVVSLVASASLAACTIVSVESELLRATRCPRTRSWNCDAIGCVEQPGDPVPICPG